MKIESLYEALENFGYNETLVGRDTHYRFYSNGVSQIRLTVYNNRLSGYWFKDKHEEIQQDEIQEILCKCKNEWE